MKNSPVARSCDVKGLSSCLVSITLLYDLAAVPAIASRDGFVATTVAVERQALKNLRRFSLWLVIVPDHPT